MQERMRTFHTKIWMESNLLPNQGIPPFVDSTPRVVSIYCAALSTNKERQH